MGSKARDIQERNRAKGNNSQTIGAITKYEQTKNREVQQMNHRRRGKVLNYEEKGTPKSARLRVSNFSEL